MAAPAAMAAAEAAASTVAAASATAAVPASASAATAAFGKRQICRANGDPERTEACRKSHDDKLDSELFAELLLDDVHDVFLPQKGAFCGARPTRF
jgi:hypothetical protein